MSVIVPVCNRERYIGDAIRSVLDQTLSDLEVIVVDDGSTDSSTAVVQALGDPRIRIVRHGGNRGIPAARNTGLEQAAGRFIAWLDSDDVARPERLERQVAFLDAHPAVAMVGCCAGKFSASGRRRRGIRIPPLAAADIRAWLLFRSAFQQSSVTGRADILRRFPYGEGFPVCEDVDVFVRLAEAYPLANLPEVLIDRRVHDGQTVRLRQQTIRERRVVIAARQLERLGMAYTEDDLVRHAMLGKTSLGDSPPPADFLTWARDWMTRIRARNMVMEIYDPESLRLATGYFWVLACRAAMPSLGRGAALKALAGSGLTVDPLINPRGRAWLRQALPLMLG